VGYGWGLLGGDCVGMWEIVVEKIVGQVMYGHQEIYMWQVVPGL